MTKTISNEDIFNLLQEFMQMTSDRFDRLEERMERLEGRMDQIESRMDRLEKTSREHTVAIQELTKRIDKLEMHIGGLDDDVKYLYQLIEKFKKDLKAGKLTDEETRSRLEELEAIAKQLSVRVGLKV